MDEFTSVIKVILIAFVSGLLLGSLWTGRWWVMAVTVLACAIFALPLSAWDSFASFAEWNSSHWIWLIGLSVLSVAFLGTSSLLGATLSRWLRFKAKGKQEHENKLPNNR
jgi:hypothetical protein